MTFLIVILKPIYFWFTLYSSLLYTDEIIHDELVPEQSIGLVVTVPYRDNFIVRELTAMQPAVKTDKKMARLGTPKLPNHHLDQIIQLPCIANTLHTILDTAHNGGAPGNIYCIMKCPNFLHSYKVKILIIHILRLG